MFCLIFAVWLCRQTTDKSITIYKVKIYRISPNSTLYNNTQQLLEKYLRPLHDNLWPLDKLRLIKKGNEMDPKLSVKSQLKLKNMYELTFSKAKSYNALCENEPFCLTLSF